MSIPVGEVTITNGYDPIKRETFNGTRKFPFYSCGHCSRPIAFRSDRSRPREHCLSCDRYLCEKTPACMRGCTPIHDLARDRFESAGHWGALVPEIMGVSPVII